MKMTKYRKLSILGSITMIPIMIVPIVLTSCSSNEEIQAPQVVATSSKFLTDGSVNHNNKLNKIFSSNAKNDLRSVSEHILEYLILDKKDNINVANLVIDPSSLVANDAEGKLSLSYAINAYWEENTYIEDNPKVINLKMSGFLIKTNATQFLDRKNADVTGSVLASYDVTQIKTKIDDLKSWLFNNEISGNKNGLAQNNIVIILMDKLDISNGSVAITYKLNKYWSTSGIINESSKDYLVNLNGFVKRNLSNEETIKLISPGGNADGLIYSGYLNVLKLLNINSNTRLDILNNSNINAKIHELDDFKTINLEITSGNQLNKTLSVTITGSYKNVAIPTSNNVINITGFKNLASDYKLSKSLSVLTMHVNFDQYFIDLQDDSSMTKWTSTQWLTKYLEKMEIIKHPQGSDYVSIDAIDYYNAKIFSNPQFNNIDNVINNDTKWSEFRFSFDYINYSYNTTSKVWESILDSGQQSFSYNFVSKLSFKKPKRADALNYIAANKIIVDQNKISKYYASLFYGFINESGQTEIINDILTIDQTYLTKYFGSDSIVLQAETGSVYPDDMLGTLALTYKLEFNSGEEIFNSNSINLTGFKKISNFIDSYSDSANNLASIKRDNTLFNRIVKSVKTEFSNDELSAMQHNDIKTMTSKPISFTPSGNSGYIYNGTSNNANSRSWNDQVLNNIKFIMLGWTLESAGIINTENNLTRDSKNRFYLELIYYTIDQSAKPILKKVNNVYQYKVPFTYQISVQANPSSIDINASYFVNLLPSDLGLTNK